MDNTTRRMKPEEFEEGVMQRRHATDRWETAMARGYAVKDRDAAEILRTHQDAVRVGRLGPSPGRSAREIAQRLCVMTRDGAVLRGAVAVFGKRVVPDFPQCSFRLARFKGRDKTELIGLLEQETFWHHKRWAAKALGALGRIDEAIKLAESSRGPWTSDHDVNAICEGLLLSAGRVEEAYSRCAIGANGGGTYLGTFRAIAKRYPHKEPVDRLAQAVRDGWMRSYRPASCNVDAVLKPVSNGGRCLRPL